MSETQARPARQVPPRRWVTIREVEHVTPLIVRLLVQGDDLAGFETNGPGPHVKLILPPPGEEKPTLPIRYEDGKPVFADPNTKQPFLRTYTPLRFNSEKLELEVELLLHGEGLASNWLRNAAVGQQIVVAGPRGGWAVPEDGDWYVVAADESGTPAAGQVYEALPKKPHAFVLEASGSGEERNLGAIDKATPDWLHRGEDISLAGKPIEDAIRSLRLPDGKGYLWIACEAGAMRRIRRYLIDERGLAPDQLVTRGYWKLGATDHPDGDYGQDVQGGH